MKGKKFLALIGSLFLVLALVLPFASGCTGEGPGPTGNYIILGAPLSEAYPDGAAAKENLQLAVNKINTAGGVTVGNTTYNLTLISRDTRDLEPGVPVSEALTVVTKLITQDKADFIVGGPIRSEAALAAMDTVSNAQVVTIFAAGFLSPLFGSTFASNPTKYKYCFRTQGGTGPLVGEAVTILTALNSSLDLSNSGAHAPRAWIVYQNVGHGIGASTAINGNLTALGWNITGISAVTTGDATPFPAILSSANSSQTQILFMWFDMPASSNLITTWAAAQYNMLPVGFIVPALDSLAWNSTLGAIQYVVDVYPKAGITPWNTAAANYISAYQTAGLYGGVPARTWVGPTCYEVPYIIKDAVERAGSLADNAVIAALEATNLTGPYGIVSFGATHDIVGGANQNPATGAITAWVQWQAGAVQKAVYPDAVGNISDIVAPSWGINP